MGTGSCHCGISVLAYVFSGFTATLFLLTSGLEYLHRGPVLSVMTAASVGMVNASDLLDNMHVQDWLPLVCAVAAVGAMAYGGSRLASGETFFPPKLSQGAFPVIFSSVLAGHFLASFYLHFEKQKTAEFDQWIPLILAAAVASVLTRGGARLAVGHQSFLSPRLTTGPGPLLVMLVLGSFFLVGLLVALEGKHGHWHEWIHLMGAVGAVGLISHGGARFSQGLPFFSESLSKGPVPAAVMSLLGAYFLASFTSELAVKNYDPNQWIGLALAVILASVITHGGARHGQGLPFMPDYLTQGVVPPLIVASLGLFTTLSFIDAVNAHGGAEPWIHLIGATAAAGGVSFLGVKYAKGTI